MLDTTTGADKRMPAGLIAKSEVIKVSPGKAQSFLENNNFHLQRSPRPAHIASLVSAMKNGEFPPGTAIYFVQTPKSLELIDGQHRFRAQIAADIDIDYTVITIVTEDIDAASSLYTQFDIGAKRSITDRMKALNLDSHIGLPAKQAHLLATGAPYLKYRFGKISSAQVTQMTPLQRLGIIKEYEKGAVLFFECMKPAEKWITKAFMRPHFVALGAYLCQYAPDTARAFWTAIATNNCGATSDPRSQMFNLAQNVETESVALRRAVVIAQAFIRGWNAMIEEKEITAKLSPAPFPSEQIKILGINAPSISNNMGASTKTQNQVFGEVLEQLSKLLPKNDNQIGQTEFTLN